MSFRKYLAVALVGAAFAASVLCVNAADTSGTFLPGPGGATGLNYEDPLSISRTAPTGIPTTITNTSMGLFTNFNFRIVRDSEVTITTTLGARPLQPSATTNVVVYVETSPNGIVWNTNSPLTYNHAISASNTTVRSFTIPQTNFGANMWGRIRGISNTVLVGEGSIFPSNVVVNTWRPRNWRQ